MEILRVIQPGPYTTIQDLGRFGFQDMGVPVSGALDSLASRAANMLVGNAANAAILEITFAGPELEVLADTQIALTGADLSLRINGKPVRQWMAHPVQPGDRIVCGQAQSGCRACMAVRGGLAVPEVMGSRSTYVSGKIGGMQGRTLQVGDVLSGYPAVGPDRSRRLDWRPLYGSDIRLRALPGPQDAYFSKALDIFFATPFTVTSHTNRMGCRLQGTPLERDPEAPPSIISEPIVHGNVQVPADGQPIILMVEQTIGGYAKIATVISADLFKIAQARPGDHIRFFPVTLEEAHRISREWLSCLAEAGL